MKSIQDFKMDEKTIMVRVDYNVPMADGLVQDMSRITASFPTIRDLQKKNAKIILMSHLGRPKGRVQPDLSLRPVASVLEEQLGKGVVHFCDILEKDSITRFVETMNPGDVLLLENLRFIPGEEKNDADFARMLASCGDFFVNDAFSASHRAHASVEGITHYLPSCAGSQLMTEIAALEMHLSRPQKPLWAIVGGAKISTKLPLLKALLEIADGIFVGGAMASTLLKSQGHSVGKSLVENDLLEECQDLIQLAQKKNRTLLWPTDVVVAKNTDPHGQSKRVSSVVDIALDEMILDAGEETIKNLKTYLDTAKTIVWNGPLGLVEVSPYDEGTQKLGTLISAYVDTVKIAGGGDTVSILKKLDLIDQFTYVSLAGGAFLEWLEGRELPGIKALTD